MALPTPVVQRADLIHLYSYTPLTTWTPPASCATNIPTIYAGTCYDTGCSAYSATDVPAALATDGAYVNYPQFSANGVMTSTACMPPGYKALESFYFTPATGCPSGLTTATTETAYSRVTVACCPS